MKILLVAAGAAIVTSATAGPERRTDAELFRAPAIERVVDGVLWQPGNWEPYLAAGEKGNSWGNHRAVVSTDGANHKMVTVTIPWRRHDDDPSAKSIVVIDSSNGSLVNSVATRVDNSSGEIVFEPNSGSTTYFIYYMPWQSSGGYYPKINYPADMHQSDSAWIAGVRSTDHTTLPRATTTAIQSVNEFHSFFPMEVAASPIEINEFLDVQDGWRVVAEHRDYPIRMRHSIPYHWTQRTDPHTLESKALRGESFSFQVGVVAGLTSLDSVGVFFEGFPPDVTAGLTCYNCDGVDENGQRFQKHISVPAGDAQALWIGWIVPDDYPAGTVSGRVVVRAKGMAPKAATLKLEVSQEKAQNHGYNEPEMMTRLPWLNSTVGTDPDYLIEPFTPVEIEGQRLKILGRQVQLGTNGLPQAIESYFTPEMTSVGRDAAPVLAAPIDLEVIIGGKLESLTSEEFTVEKPARGVAEWRVNRRSNQVEMLVEGRLEYDGMLDYRVTVKALTDLSIDDIRLPVILEKAAAHYMLGLGAKGGARPNRVDWQWKVENHQEGVWLGAVNRGLQYVLRDQNYARPLNTNFYQNQPLRMPVSWYNSGKGGIRIEETANGDVRALNYSGPRQLASGDSLHFNVRFLITPFKPLDTAEHFRTRFVHKYVPVDSVVDWGGTVVNIHHANEINPYINYPFFSLDAQTDYIEEAHSKGIKVKLYDTIRELSYRAHELFALRSLGDEILNDGDGGGHSWLQEHLGGNYHSAWHAWRVDDAAILDKGTSRWTNYYVEGLSWLASNQNIDGLYLDDIAFSRATVKRMVAVLDAERDEVVIDLHSANQFNDSDGHINSAMLYMEHFPFISRLWFGEYFDYGDNPDYWMTEVSGLPFGLMGEMLQDGGRPYRGMLYGMTTRLYGDVDPRPVWRMMDDFGIAESQMLGYWLPEPPVETSRGEVLGTAYQTEDKILLALASWSDEDLVLSVNLAPALTAGWSGYVASSPKVDGLQEATMVDLSRLKVPADKGLWVILERLP